MKEILLAVVLIAIAVIGLGIKVLFIKGGRFPSGHAHDIERRQREARARLSSNGNRSKTMKH